MSSEFDGLIEKGQLYLIFFFLYSDVSWGTKGDNKVSTDLGVVKANKGENVVEVAVPTAEKDINAAYEDAIHVLTTKPPKEDKKVDTATAQEDFYRNFRTKWVATFFPGFG
jgi:chitin synthase